MEIRCHRSISDLGIETWQSLEASSNPFVAGDWLNALETTECVGQASGWVPLHIGLWDGKDLLAAAPTYAKGHSMGEFVYDWSWAAFSERMGRPYYPKLVVASPFSPATGERLLLSGPEHMTPLLHGLRKAG